MDDFSLSEMDSWSVDSRSVYLSETVHMVCDRRTSKKSQCKSVAESVAQKSWIEKVFFKRECICFVRSQKDPNRCGCGRAKKNHTVTSDISLPLPDSSVRWDPWKHTQLLPTDAFGTLEFQGGPHPTKAQYVRMSHETQPEVLLHLLTKHWGLELPKLLISVHGGIVNFDLQPKLKRVFRKGLLKAANTTGAWIVTGGTNTGVTRHVGEGIGEQSLKTRNNIVTIGIAPWGIVHNRQELIGKDVVRPYHAIAPSHSHYAVLNQYHSYFFLVDNGTVGKYGAEIQLRKKLEKVISLQKITSAGGIVKGHGVPLVSLILEGGTNTIRTVLDCVTDDPPIPVVICDGSGRAADILAFTHKYANEDGTMPEAVKSQLILTIEKTFQYNKEESEKLYMELMLAVNKKELITVFRMGEGENTDIDLAILTALLKGQNASAPDQLSLALTWNRVDIAKKHIFVYGREWPEGALEHAMMDALTNDRVDFVKLLLQNGVSMQKFLTIPRLEELYNIKQATPTSVPFRTFNVLKKKHPEHAHYTLLEVGQVIDYLMGGAYRASYCRKKFRTTYNAMMKKSPSQIFQGHNISNALATVPMPGNLIDFQDVFKYPFNELLVWAVLMKRQKMAMCMWQHGEEAMAKALVALKIYKTMTREAEQDDLEVEIFEELRTYSKEFQNITMELLEVCYKTDADATKQLLTYELKNWSNQTCLSLAVSAVHREFLAHPCCQMLLTDMWMGGLNMRKYTVLKVLMGILIPPLLLALEYKSKEELQLMPQTVEEHIGEIEDSDTESNVSRRSSYGEQDIEMEMINASQGQNTERTADATEATSPVNSPVSPPVNSNGPLLDQSALTVHRVTDFMKKKSPLRVGKKVYEFYAAPITKFWLHTMAYVIFLASFNYVVLVKTPPKPSWVEIYVMAYIFTLAIDKAREIIASEPVKALQKFSVFFGDFWNILDVIAIILYIIGAVLRNMESYIQDGHVVFSVDIIFWYIRILDIFSVSKHLGPYVMMVGKMVVDMINFIVILLIVLMSFGVCRQAIKFPNEEPNWNILKEVFLEPYFMLYGEVYADKIDPKCGGPHEEPCVHGHWVTPAVMTIFLLVANILLLSLLIAVFNSTFNRVNANSRQIWKFLRYTLVIENEQKPLLPPPFIVLSHVYLIVKYVIRRCKGKLDIYDNGLKLFLDEEDVEVLHDFEEDCVEDLFRQKENLLQSSTEQRIRVTNDRVENMALRLDDLNQKESAVKLSIQAVDFRMAKMEEMLLETAQNLANLQRAMAEVATSTQSLITPPVLSQEGGNLSPMTEVMEEETSSQGTETPTSADVSFPVKAPVTSTVAEATSEATLTTTTTAAAATGRGKKKFGRRVKFGGSMMGPAQTKPHLFRRQASAPASVVYARPYYNKSASSFHEAPTIDPKYAHTSLLQRRHVKALQKISVPKSSARKEDNSSNNSALLRQSAMEEFVRNASRMTQGSIQEPPLFTSASLKPSLTPSYQQGLGVSGEFSSPKKAPSKGDEQEHPQSIPSSSAAHGPNTSAYPITVPAYSTSIPGYPASGVPYPTSVPASEYYVPYSSPYSAVGGTFFTPAPTTMIPAFTPFLSQHRAEYTSITDDIDTSYVQQGSPESIPGTPHFSMSSYDSQDELREAKGGSPEKDAIIVEAKVLKHAEESEHEIMEPVIRCRIRQISISENEGLSDSLLSELELVHKELIPAQAKNSSDEDSGKEMEEDGSDETVNEGDHGNSEVEMDSQLDLQVGDVNIVTSNNQVQIDISSTSNGVDDSHVNEKVC
ncbi:transient receptor potential cation channel subfamily M member 1-like isoform X2 [Lingula anatina]|uniref:Transient receptor potential cation channel subfamily M member 1-like isoform X2 n=1 Tax=Lingula anatina TaxID=7574 RepID=A0A1S3IH29_LINAN|nr:transient receptor potential cation channel subfamily M member 1-like isoform X2 [Lingula anatina]|eukprot:XP_013397522.1 transient receptor potential cation channel subfamily M member 1-like isoform X2 [Lingula anatina]